MVKRKQRLFNSRTQPLKKRALLPLTYDRDRNEYKVTDTAVIGGSCVAVGLVTSLTSNLTRGTLGLNNYIGRTLTPVSVQIRYSIVGTQTGGVIPLGPDSYNNCRIIVFQWFGESVPAPLDVIMSTNSTQAPFSATQINNISKFRILHDKMITTYLNTYDGTNSTGTSQNGKCYIKRNRLEKMSYATNVGSGLETGGLYILFVSDSVVTPNPTFNFYSRVTFID